MEFHQQSAVKIQMRCQRLSAHKSQRFVKVRRSEWWSQNGHTQETKPPKQGHLKDCPPQRTLHKSGALQTFCSNRFLETKEPPNHFASAPHNELLWNLRAPPNLRDPTW